MLSYVWGQLEGILDKLLDPRVGVKRETGQGELVFPLQRYLTYG